MLRDLVNQARSGSTSAELEAITAERDFFREKYAEQIDAMEEMKGQLKESQRMIAKLRSQILDLEIEKSAGGHGSGVKAPKQIQSSGGSANTSVTGMTCDDDLTTRSGAENNAEPVTVSEVADAPVAIASVASPRNVDKTEEEEDAQDVDRPEPLDEDQSAQHDESESDADEEEDSGSEDDDVEKIRANAARMLLWANYQSTKRSTPNTSMVRDEDDETELPTPSKIVSDDIVYSLPTSLDKRRTMMDDDDDSTLGSSSRHHPEPSVGSWRSGVNSRAGSGKIGNMFNNLRDMIDPPSESEIDSESESDEE